MSTNLQYSAALTVLAAAIKWAEKNPLGKRASNSEEIELWNAVHEYCVEWRLCTCNPVEGKHEEWCAISLGAKS